MKKKKKERKLKKLRCLSETTVWHVNDLQCVRARVCVYVCVFVCLFACFDFIQSFIYAQIKQFDLFELVCALTTLALHATIYRKCEINNYHHQQMNSIECYNPLLFVSWEPSWNEFLRLQWFERQWQMKTYGFCVLYISGWDSDMEKYKLNECFVFKLNCLVIEQPPASRYTMRLRIFGKHWQILNGNSLEDCYAESVSVMGRDDIHKKKPL